MFVGMFVPPHEGGVDVITHLSEELHETLGSNPNPGDWAFRVRSGERGRAPSESEARGLSALSILGGHIRHLLRWCKTNGWTGDEMKM